VEFLIILIWTHTHSQQCPFIKGLYKSLAIPKELVQKILYRGTPLFANEFLWSLGMSALTQRYSTRGLDVVAAVNISNTIFNLFNVMVISMGSVIAIIIGNLLGASKNDEAVDTDRKLITMAVLICVVFGGIEFICAPLFPELYNTEPEIKELAANLLRINGCCLPIHAFLNASYFTLRSGGKTIITFFFDSVFVLLVSFPIAFALSAFTAMPILPLYICVQAADLFKVALGAILLRKRIWINNLVE
jgi:Na+-driven multidrug efflux pump